MIILMTIFDVFFYTEKKAQIGKNIHEEKIRIMVMILKCAIKYFGKKFKWRKASKYKED